MEEEEAEEEEKAQEDDEDLHWEIRRWRGEGLGGALTCDNE